MRRLALAAFFCLIAAVARGEAPPTVTVAQPAGRITALDGHNFTLPAGFTIERIAGPPLVDRPIVADFDEGGRLFVADSSGSNEKVALQLENPTHRIVRLEDADGDGRFDKSVVFADKMMFPEGTLWYGGSLYVSAPPQIWKLTDADDDGVADRREVWFDGKTLGGCANDLHGPYLGPDGWIYWCKGGFQPQEYELPGGKKFKSRAAHIFRARPDGTGIEPVMTGGMDNPVDVAFTPGGERIFTTTFLQRPAGGNRDGLIHAVYGGIYGKDQEVIYEPAHRWTSPELMPVLTHLGPAAPCGLHRLESDQLGVDYQDNLFACQFNLRKVSRHVLKPSGSTFTTEDHDFVVSDNTDFHPTDVVEDADGSLLIVDTGGWYKLCCPSSQLVKADVLGAIYRVRRTGSQAVADPRGRKIDWKAFSAEKLADLLDDPRPAVRKQAIERLVANGPVSAVPLSKILADRNSDPTAARAAISAACRIDSSLARRLIHEVMRHEDENVVQAAVHAASTHREGTAVAQFARLLKSRSLHNRRGAAEGLGRIGSNQSPLLIEALADPMNDRALEHSLTFALIELADRDELQRSVNHENPRVRRCVLMALDQIGADLKPQVVLDGLQDADPAIRDAARWIAARHPEWDAELSAFLRQRLRASDLAETEQAALIDLLAKLAKGPGVQNVLAEATAEVDSGGAKIALAAMAASGEKELPAAWASLLPTLLAADSPQLASSLALVRAVPPAKADVGTLAAALAKLADSDAAADVRLMALAAMPGERPAISLPQLELLLAHIHRDQSANLRGLAADALSHAALSPQQLQQLAAALPSAAPLELDRLLAPFAQSTDEAAGLALLTAFRAPELRAAVTVDTIRQRLAKYPPSVQVQAEQLYAQLDAEFAGQRSRLEETLAALPAGDIRRGQAIFNSAKTSCRACHTIGYVGGKHGPDLTRIGQIRQPRDLLESILFPSASFVRSYEPLAVRLLDGQVHSGIVKSDAPTEIVLTLAADKEVRIAKDEIEIAQPGKVSIMPAGLDKQLSLQELADLVEFLKNCR
jgi:putative membrane-bound dehydrogenase-like protein